MAVGLGFARLDRVFRRADPPRPAAFPTSNNVASMSLQGPIVAIAGQKNPDLADALAAAGAFPVIESSWSDAADAIARIEPAAVVMDAPKKPAEAAAARAVRAAIDTAGGPYVPVVARVADGAMPEIPGALPIAADASPDRIVIRLASALRVRTLHAAALRRGDALEGECEDLPVLPASDPLEDATVIVTGRGRTYPALTTAVGEEVGLIGAMSVETAAKFLTARDVDGIVIGEGFNPLTIEAFLTVLAEDTRFRDLPIALLPALPGTSRRRPRRDRRAHPAAGPPARIRGAAPAPTRRARSQGPARSANRPVHGGGRPARPQTRGRRRQEPR